MGCPWVTREFVALVHGSPMSRPCRPRVYRTGPWVTRDFTLIVHGSPMALSWVTHGSPAGLPLDRREYPVGLPCGAFMGHPSNAHERLPDVYPLSINDAAEPQRTASPPKPSRLHLTNVSH